MSSYSEGQTHQLMDSFEANGWTADELRLLGQSKRHGEFRGVFSGTHEIRPIDHIIDLSVPCKLPFNGAERVSPAKSGVVKLEKRGNDLYLDGRKIDLFLSEGQKGGNYVVGHELRKELEAKGGNVSAKVLDYLVEHPKLWPESWKKNSKGDTVYVFFWDDIFRSSDGGLGVRCGYWRDGRVVSLCGWLSCYWNASNPSASRAS